MDSRIVRLGTRPSALARAQTELVAAALRDAHPDIEVEVVAITTHGDRSQASNQTGPEWGTGVFVKELETALLREEVDLAVHAGQGSPARQTGPRGRESRPVSGRV